MGREHLTYHLVVIKRQFSDTRFKANASNILYEGSQIYKYVTNITNLSKTSTIVPIKFVNNIFFCRNG